MSQLLRLKQNLTSAAPILVALFHGGSKDLLLSNEAQVGFYIITTLNRACR